MVGRYVGGMWNERGDVVPYVDFWEDIRWHQIQNIFLVGLTWIQHLGNHRVIWEDEDKSLYVQVDLNFGLKVAVHAPGICDKSFFKSLFLNSKVKF